MGTEPVEGVYRYRAGKGAPWQPVRVLHDGFAWHVLLIGVAVPQSGQADWLDIPFLKYHWPLHPVTLPEYHRMIDDYRNAKPGTPLWQPGDPVDLRASAPL